MRWVAAIERDALLIDEMRGVCVDGRPVLFVHLEDGVRAYEDRCAHQGHPLSRGSLDRGVVECAVHGWTFDARTGTSRNPRGERLVPLDVREDAGMLLVALPDRREGAR